MRICICAQLLFWAISYLVWSFGSRSRSSAGGLGQIRSLAQKQEKEYKQLTANRRRGRKSASSAPQLGELGELGERAFPYQATAPPGTQHLGLTQTVLTLHPSLPPPCLPDVWHRQFSTTPPPSSPDVRPWPLQDRRDNAPPSSPPSLASTRLQHTWHQVTHENISSNKKQEKNIKTVSAHSITKQKVQGEAPGHGGSRSDYEVWRESKSGSRGLGGGRQIPGRRSCHCPVWTQANSVMKNLRQLKDHTIKLTS